MSRFAPFIRSFLMLEVSVKTDSFTALRRTSLAAAMLALIGCSAFAHAAGVSPADIQAYADRANFSADLSSTEITHYIVTYAENAAERSSAAMLNDFDRVSKETGLKIQHTRTLATGAELVEVTGTKKRGLANRADAAREVMVAFAKNPAVAYVEPDRLMTAALTPNDTSYSSQWDLFESTGGMNQPSAWDIATGSGIKVAVIDTGITPHSDLSGQTIGGYDFISSSATARDGDGRDSNPNDEGDWFNSTECSTGYASNSSWHGTHVTGTIAALTNNAKGVAGIAYGAKVVPVRVLGRCGGTTADIVDAIVWASGGSVSGVPTNANPARVINMSLGGSGSCGSFQAAVNTARTNGTVVVVAAGNSNANVTGFSPANCTGVISVAATNRAGARASYSNYGTTITVSAPGGETSSSTANGILSTLNNGTTTQGAEGYAYYQGTSMAAPHVAGLAAQILSLNSSLTPDQVKNYITGNARALPGACSGGCGAGIINALATLQAVGGTTGNVAPVANFSFTTSGLTANFTDSSTDSDGTVVSRSWNFGDGTTSTATSPSKTYSAAGTYSVALTVTDNGGATNTKTSSVTVSSGASNVLQNGVTVTGLGATTGNSLTYTMVVPAGATNLKFQIAGGTGDADLYVRFGTAPTTSVYDCRPYASGNNETCNITTAQAGTYYVTLVAYSTFAGVSLTGSYTAASGNVLQNGVAVTGLSAATNAAVNYTMVVPAGATNLTFQIAGGTGDADLYVRFGTAPTTSVYDCRPYLSGNNETCNITTAQAGTYYVMVRAYAAYTGVSLTGSYTP
jgi:serine protease